MDPSSSAFNNYDIEVVKKSIKCDSFLFLVLFSIPIALACLIQDIETAFNAIFWCIIYLSPYGLTALFGFLASSNEKSYANCYSGMLKCTFIYCVIGIGTAGLTFIFMLYGFLTSECNPAVEDRCGFVEGIILLCLILSILYLVYSITGFVFWWFANKHVNSLIDLLVRNQQNFQNQAMTERVATNAQFMPVPGIPVGDPRQMYPQYNVRSFEMH